MSGRDAFVDRDGWWELGKEAGVHDCCGIDLERCCRLYSLALIGNMDWIAFARGIPVWLRFGRADGGFNLDKET